MKAANACTDDYEIVMLDDCSRDDTPRIMEELAQTDPARVRMIRHPVNMGIAATFEDLYRAATKDYVLLIPADGEYPPEILSSAWPMRETCDIVVCHRVQKNYTLYRQLVSKVYRYGTALLFGVDLYDPGSVKLVKREVYTNIHTQCLSVYVEAERIIRAAYAGYRLGKVEMVQQQRLGGEALGARWKTVGNAGRDMLWLWWKLRILKNPKH